MFVAGSVVELIDLPTGQHRYIQTTGGYSIGALIVRIIALFSFQSIHFFNIKSK